MNTQHNPNVAKLSEAMALGNEIARERGIKQGRVNLFGFKAGTISCACALGMVLIGKYGVDYILDNPDNINNGIGYEVLDNDFKADTEASQCLLNNIPEAYLHTGFIDVKSAVYKLNDGAERSIDEIVETLASCGL